MAAPQAYKAYRRSKGAVPKTIQPTTEELPPTLNENDVLIRIHAVSLNYRDVAMLHGKYPVEYIDEGIPVSDCAAEVISVGSEVRKFKIGDHVMPIFDLNNQTGTEDGRHCLGGEAEGVLREYAIFHKDVLLHLPKHLSWEEVSPRTLCELYFIP